MWVVYKNFSCLRDSTDKVVGDAVRIQYAVRQQSTRHLSIRSFTMGLETWLATLVAVIGCLVGAVYLYYRKVFQHWKKRGVPHLEPSFPFGNAKDMILARKNFGEVNDKWYKELEPHDIAGFYISHRKFLMVRSPDLIKLILIKEFAHFHDRGFFLDEENDPISAHLFFLNGLRWKNLRNKLTPTFTSGKLKMMFSTMLDCGNELKDFMEGPAERKEELEVKDIMARFTTDIIASTAFGITCNCLKNPDAEFRVWGRRIFKTSVTVTIRQLIVFLFPSLGSVLKIPNVPKNVANFFRSVVKETIEYREKNNVERKDFMQLLIHLKNHGVIDDEKDDVTSDSDENATGLTLDEVAAQAFVFYTAGFETSSTTLSFCLYELAVNPDVQDKLRAEILSTTEQYEGKVTYESIVKMQYLDKVIAETLRKYPPVPSLNRTCTSAISLPGFDYVITENDDIVIPVYSLHRDPKYFPNPEAFNPEHFSEEAKSKRPGYVYLPFGDGPRLCIGQRFGLMQVKVGLVKLLSHFQFHVSKKTPLPLVFDPRSFIVSPLGGMWLQVTKIDS